MDQKELRKNIENVKNTIERIKNGINSINGEIKELESKEDLSSTDKLTLQTQKNDLSQRESTLKNKENELANLESQLGNEPELEVEFDSEPVEESLSLETVPEPVEESLSLETVPEPVEESLSLETVPEPIEESLSLETVPEPVEESLSLETVPEPVEESLSLETVPEPVEESLSLETVPEPVEEALSLETVPEPVEEALSLESVPEPVEESLSLETEPGVIEESVSLESVDNEDTQDSDITEGSIFFNPNTNKEPSAPIENSLLFKVRLDELDKSRIMDDLENVLSDFDVFSSLEFTDDEQHNNSVVDNLLYEYPWLFYNMPNSWAETDVRNKQAIHANWSHSIENEDNKASVTFSYNDVPTIHVIADENEGIITAKFLKSPSSLDEIYIISFMVSMSPIIEISGLEEYPDKALSYFYYMTLSKCVVTLDEKSINSISNDLNKYRTYLNIRTIITIADLGNPKLLINMQKKALSHWESAGLMVKSN